MNPSKEICEFIEKMNSPKQWDLEESAHNTDDNQKADGEPWKSRMSHIGVLKKKIVEKMNSSKQCDLDESADNNVDDVTSTTQKANREPRKKESAILGYWKKS